MAKQHTDTFEEYKFIKNKALKILNKPDPKAKLLVARAKKQTRKFIKRMKEIVELHYDMGLPHPEAEFKPSEDLKRQLERLKQNPGKDVLTNPDGSLYSKNSGLIQDGAGFQISNKGVLNPDGTLFETPIMEGSVLNNPLLHSEEKLQEYLKNQDDGDLRTEE